MTTLMIDAGPVGADAPVTRVGGVPLAPEGTAWPGCSACDGPMQFLAQVLLDDLGGGGSERRGVLALFACQNDPGACADWDPTSGGNRALLLPPDGLRPIPLPDRAEAGADDEAGDEDEDEDEDEESVLLLGATRAVHLQDEDEPDYHLARAAWATRAGRPESAVLGRLGGSPDWLQYDETPTCPSCARPMPLIAQLQEGPDPITAMNFGGGGRAYAFACEPCSGAAFLWQC
ncbi:DUF1963 domain-containing protein [Kitasatospora camelliae]|uniref:DUF1963 domain-containing protein n=1 Tax=Kitasatospora camelliae TaxID=3156397 RepID=A0AAU8K8Q0_9ACTN